MKRASVAMQCVAASVLWLWLIEGQAPPRWDVMGAGLCIVGTCVIVYGAR